jgi:hypothetical protein
MDVTPPSVTITDPSTWYGECTDFTEKYIYESRVDPGHFATIFLIFKRASFTICTLSPWYPFWATYRCSSTPIIGIIVPIMLMLMLLPQMAHFPQ